jgi:hypothetical protein
MTLMFLWTATAYGGMELHVTWLNTNNITTLNTDPGLRSTLRACTQKLVTRVNRKTGVAYVNDPASLGASWQMNL